MVKIVGGVATMRHKKLAGISPLLARYRLKHPITSQQRKI
ncbi:hypothetical protein HMPREF0454_04312 [Hafnia alvei ATCC 51873]|uniref:Uncharacterized protein n=1 Tax=Hafnia alvei ATCC 51873 TaxID=1002364 RepID=G9YCH4_HAFAL|nr:hypothetical protein HMPREF0454_04312 [Hafnia alvei ATCC 51873]